MPLSLRRIVIFEGSLSGYFHATQAIHRLQKFHKNYRNKVHCNKEHAGTNLHFNVKFVSAVAPPSGLQTLAFYTHDS